MKLHRYGKLYKKFFFRVMLSSFTYFWKFYQETGQ